jgi:putative transposase
MGTAGDCYDNALCESFFATLECELLDRTSFPTHAMARRELFDYIEGWYNPHRRHSALNYQSPLDFERSASLEVAAQTA